MASPPAALPPAAMKQLKAMQGKHSRLQEKLDADYKKKLTDLDTKIEKAEQGLQSLFKQRKDTMERHKNDKAKLLKEQQAESANLRHSQQSAVESCQLPLARQQLSLKRRIQTASSRNPPQKIQPGESGSKHAPIDLSSDGEVESESPQHGIPIARHQPSSQQHGLGSTNIASATLNVAPSVTEKNIDGDQAQTSRNKGLTVVGPSSPFIKGKQPITPSRPDSTPRKRACSIDISSDDNNEANIEGRKKAIKGKGPTPKKHKPDPVAARFGFKGLAYGHKASASPVTTPSKAPRENVTPPSGRGSLDKSSTKAKHTRDNLLDKQDLEASPTPRKRAARLNAEAKLAQYNSLAAEHNTSDAEGERKEERSKRCYRQSSDIDGVKNCLRRMSLTPIPAHHGCETGGRRCSTASTMTASMNPYMPPTPVCGPATGRPDNIGVRDRDRECDARGAPQPVIHDDSDEEEPDISHYEMRNGVIVRKGCDGPAT